jgi:16S rRNA (guanine527-N7)-methyltransferase
VASPDGGPESARTDGARAGGGGAGGGGVEGSEPEAAGLVFGPALPIAREFAALLSGPGVERGLLGPRESARIWDRHLLNSAAVAELIPPRSRLADLGSGAGLPGLVLAILLPDTDVILVEPMARRTAFLAECVSRLGLRNVQVRRARAEDLAGQVGADVVTSRAVARLDRLAGLAAGLARPGGQVLAIKGAGAEREVQEAAGTFRRLGAEDVEIVSVGSGVLSEPTTVVRFTTARVRRG